MNRFGLTKEQFLKNISAFVTSEKYLAAKRLVYEMNEEEFSAFLDEASQYTGGQSPTTAREAINSQRAIMESLGIKSTDLAINQQAVKLLSVEENESIKSKINRSHPSDYFLFSSAEDEFLIDLWENETGREVTIPSDLFFAKTIPLSDCVITIDERNASSFGTITKFRVVVFDDYQDTVNSVVDSCGKTIGTVGAIIPINLTTPEGHPINFFIPICVCYGVDSLVGGTIGWFDDWFKERAFLMKRGVISSTFVATMETWYGIQIALLHPAVKDVFKNPRRCPAESESSSTGKKKSKRVTKYVRKHILTIDKLESISNTTEQRKFNRKCLAWYVIGHWRTYKNGKKVFVMPYWKGVLRNLKQNAVGDNRERKIDFQQVVPKQKPPTP